MKYSAAPSLVWLLSLSSRVFESQSFHQISPVRSPRVAPKSEYQSPLVFKARSTAATTSVTSTSLEMGSVIGALRGGAVVGTATSAVANALASGPFGILGLAAISSSVITPLTLYRQAYSFSVGYSFAMMSIGLALQKTFQLDAAGPASALLTALVVYGARLGSHLLLREFTVKSKAEQLKNFDKTPRLKRIPFSLGIGLFYAFMATPALYLCRAGALSGTAATISWAGVYMAWYGATVEAITDLQKFLAKRGKDGSKDFHGPSKGWFGVSRHPNYAGELVFWLGVLVAGLPSFFGEITVGNSIAAVCGVFGFFGIYQTMTGATKRLEGRHDENYGGQASFDEWKAKTSALFPTKPLQLAGLVAPVVALAVYGSNLAPPVIGGLVPLVVGLLR